MKFHHPLEARQGQNLGGTHTPSQGPLPIRRGHGALLQWPVHALVAWVAVLVGNGVANDGRTEEIEGN